MNSKSERYFLYVTTTFCVILVLSNIIASKVCRIPLFGGHTLPAGLLTYPLTFLVTDCVTEVWGRQRAHLMIYLAFAMNFLSLLLIQLAIHLPADPLWATEANPFGYLDSAAYQNAYESVFGMNYLLVSGSLVAYLVTQLLDVKLFSYIREATSGRHLWLRNNVSTLLSQAVDTLIMGFIYFVLAMGMPIEEISPLLLTIYSYKALFSLCDTPFLYLLVEWLRRSVREEIPV